MTPEEITEILNKVKEQWDIDDGVTKKLLNANRVFELSKPIMQGNEPVETQIKMIEILCKYYGFNSIRELVKFKESHKFLR